MISGLELEQTLKDNPVDFSNIPLGDPEDKELARRQEKAIIDDLKLISPFKNYGLIGIKEFLHEQYGDFIFNENLEESLRGDIVIFRKNISEIDAFLEVKVGTNPPYDEMGTYYGAPNLTSICNKLKGKNSDNIPRIMMCVSNEWNYRICNPHQMLHWLVRRNGWMKATKNPKPDNEWSRRYNGKIRVGDTSRTATTFNKLHSNDYMPSFAIEQNYFHF